MTVQDLYDMIDRFAPFKIQIEEDNSGFLVGSSTQEVTGVLFALDVTQAVIDEAVSLGTQLIVTHHPLMFSPLRSLTDADYEGRLIRRLTQENISLIAAHTNLDQASGGMNDLLAERCRLTDISGEAFFRCGFLSVPCSAKQYAEILKDSLHTDVRIMGPEYTLIRKVGLCSGSGSSEWRHAVDTGCNAFVSGEIRHHIGLALSDSHIVGFECGHYATEEPGIRALAAALQKSLNQVECNVRFYLSGISAYSFPGNRDRR